LIFVGVESANFDLIVNQSVCQRRAQQTDADQSCCFHVHGCMPAAISNLFIISLNLRDDAKGFSPRVDMFLSANPLRATSAL
jgi:hypothetical protein